jgi:hypothetical protein
VLIECEGEREDGDRLIMVPIIVVGKRKIGGRIDEYAPCPER